MTLRAFILALIFVLLIPSLATSDEELKRIINLLPLSTVFIETVNKQGLTGGGTGFFFNFAIDGHFLPVIVTNRHVVANMTSGLIKFRRHVTPMLGPNPILHHIADFGNKWLYHPLGLDLAIMPIAGILEKITRETGAGPEVGYFDFSSIPSTELLDSIPAGEGVNMIGYPKGIHDHVNNRPLWRKGVTATKPSMDYQGRPEFAIDMSVFRGSSGSPVFILNKSTYFDHRGGILGNRFILLGVLWGTSTLDQVSHSFEQVAIGDAVSFQFASDLGYVIKIQKLLDFEPQLRALMEQQLQKQASEATPSTNEAPKNEL